MDIWEEIQIINGLFIERVYGLKGKHISESFGQAVSLTDGFRIKRFSYPDSNISKIPEEFVLNFKTNPESEQVNLWNPLTEEIFLRSK